MPTNIGHEALTGLKVGHQNVSAGYLGHQQVFPNSAQITSAVFTDTTNAAYTGSTRTFRVQGDDGAQYTLSGTNTSGGTGSYVYTLGSSGVQDHTISYTTYSLCGTGNSNRTVSVTLTPSGSTTLQGGGSSTTSSFTQVVQNQGYTTYYAVTNSSNAYFNICTSNTSKTVINGALHWATGSWWEVEMKAVLTGATGLTGASYYLAPFTSGGTFSISQGALSNGTPFSDAMGNSLTNASSGFWWITNSTATSSIPSRTIACNQNMRFTITSPALYIRWGIWLFGIAGVTCPRYDASHVGSGPFTLGSSPNIQIVPNVFQYA